MKTRVISIDPIHPDPGVIAEAATIIRAGGLVAFPTETVYGLGANALDESAVRKIFAAKGRPSDNPLIVHLAEVAEAEKYASLPDSAVVQKLADKYWPGPLTLVLQKKSVIPSVVTAGLATVSVRVPDHPVAQALIRAAGVPIAAPSANISGRPSPTDAPHVLMDLDGKVDLILDAGPVKWGVESTVLDLTTDTPTILRPGAITQEMLKEQLPLVEIERKTLNLTPKAPGMKYRHYAPKCVVHILLSPVTDQVLDQLEQVALAEGKKVGVVLLSFMKVPASLTFFQMKSIEEYAAQLYRVFREADSQQLDVLYVEEVDESGLGRAIMNRVKKAAE